VDADRPGYSIVIPPPNVTAALHLGHAFNNTLQDVLTRTHRMRGYEAMWIPGTDHAGIATQTVVEKRLLNEEGKRRTDFTREDFIARVQAWKDEYERRITDQLKAMGCSCDWSRQRFTMDDICARAVREAFFILFRDGLIYRGKRLVNWDPASQTALADDEVEMQDVAGRFYYLRYPLVHAPANPGDMADVQEVTWSELAARGYPGASGMPDDENAWVTVATTRPETYLGDTGVAINPHDPRAKPLRGLMVQLPLVGRVIPIVEDDYVVMPLEIPGARLPERDEDAPIDPKAKFATGFLKVTPAHDPNDFEIGRRHGLDAINIMAPDASISDHHGWSDVGDARIFVGLSREKARELVMREFDARGLLEKSVPYEHAVGHSYRTHVPIEPYLSDQWYVRVTDDRLVGFAQRALRPEQRTTSTHMPMRGVSGDGEMAFFPERYARSYEQWHDNLRDWCISRQLWWGHRIPVWTREFGTWKNLIGEADGPGEELITTLLALRDREPNAPLAYFLASKSDMSRPLLEADEIQDCTDLVCVVCVRRSGPLETTRVKPRDFEAWLAKHGFAQDPDVLDTWFSSALWPLSTMGWPEPEQSPETAGLLDAFNPTSLLSTAREIITLWVSRMAMFNRYFTSPDAGRTPGRIPFQHVYIHSVIQDGHGQRMSKSLGNGVDPLDIVESHGADALRWTLTSIATGTQDVRLPVDLICPHTGQTFAPTFIQIASGHHVPAPVQDSPFAPGKKMVTSFGAASGLAKPTPETPLARNTSSKFDAGRNVCNKLWNAGRFAMGMLTRGEPAPIPASTLRASERPLVDRWMLSRLARSARACDEATNAYQFATLNQALYDVLWRDFCDWYLEAIKPTAEGDAHQRAVLRDVLDAILRLLHPVIPFVTETIWQGLRELPRTTSIEGLGLDNDASMLCLAGWPAIDDALIDERAERDFARVQALAEAIRNVRATHKVKPQRRITLHLPDALRGEIEASGGLDLVRTLAGVEHVVAIGADTGTGSTPTPFTFEGQALALSDLADAVDAGAERERLMKLVGDLDKSIAALTARLSNPGYADKAPAKLVQQTRDELARQQAEREQAAAALGSLA
jgi:valyl-tRNA synthetase